MDVRMTPERILNNINAYLDHEGLRKERLAKKMGKQLSSFYATLAGKHPNAVYKFAVDLAELLGFAGTFFLADDFVIPATAQPTDRFAFSAGHVSDEARKGLEQLEKICDLIRMYDAKGESFHAGTDI